MRFIRRHHVVAAIVAATCVAAPGAASASPDITPVTFKSDAAQSGSSASTDRSDAAQSGWGVAERAATTSTFPPADFRGGDMPVDHPGASRAAATVPTTIEVIQPERTIVRDVDEALPLILSGSALLLVLAGLGITLLQNRVLLRPGRSH